MPPRALVALVALGVDGGVDSVEARDLVSQGSKLGPSPVVHHFQLVDQIKKKIAARLGFGAMEPRR